MRLGLRPRGSCYALAARAKPSQLMLLARGFLAARAMGFALRVRAMRLPLGLRPHSSCIALAGRALPSRHALRARSFLEALAILLCPRGLRYALAAWALPLPLAPCLRLGLHPCGTRYTLTGCFWLALRARGSGFAAWASPLRLALRVHSSGASSSRYALASRASPSHIAFGLGFALAALELCAHGLGFAIKARDSRSRLCLR